MAETGLEGYTPKPSEMKASKSTTPDKIQTQKGFFSRVKEKTGRVVNRARSRVNFLNWRKKEAENQTFSKKRVDKKRAAFLGAMALRAVSFSDDGLQAVTPLIDTNNSQTQQERQGVLPSQNNTRQIGVVAKGPRK